MNKFNSLSAENEMHALAKLSPEEINEANAYYDRINAAHDAEAAEREAFGEPIEFMPGAEFEARIARLNE